MTSLMKMNRGARRSSRHKKNGGEDTNDQQEEDNQSRLSGALSPTTSWRIAMTPNSNAMMQKQVSMIHTGGMDLGTLLAQETKVNTSDDHIFVDDGSTGSPAAASVAISEADMSRVSLLHIQCEEEKEAEAARDDRAFFGDQYNEEDIIEDWSLHNQQLGREVAKHVLAKAREDLKMKTAAEETKSSAGVVFQCSTTTGETKQKSSATLGQKKQHMTKSRQATMGKKKKNEDGIIFKYIKKLRKKKRALLRKIFKSQAATKATTKKKNNTGPPDIRATRTTSMDTDGSSPKSGYSSDSPQNVVAAVPTSTKSSSSSLQKGASSQKSFVENHNSKLENIQPLAESKEMQGQQSSISPANRQSSQVVDSILRQFSDLPRSRSNPSMSHQGSGIAAEHGRPRSNSISYYHHNRGGGADGRPRSNSMSNHNRSHSVSRYHHNRSNSNPTISQPRPAPARRQHSAPTARSSSSMNNNNKFGNPSTRAAEQQGSIDTIVWKTASMEI